MKFEEYRQYDALGLAKLIKSKAVSAKEVLSAAIARAQAVNPLLNAIITPLYEQAEAALPHLPLSAPLAGVPFLMKDLGGLQAGVRASFGSCLCENFISPIDSGLVKRFKQAGLVIFGRTNVPEFGTSYLTEPALFGATKNPWQLDCTPGGSSGGAAAAVASGILPMAQASDGGGSIRVPAACCGLFGLKPSRGRVSVGPEQGEIWSGLGTQFALSRSVRDSALLLDCVSGYVPGDPYCAPPAPDSYLSLIENAPKPLKIIATTDPMTAGVAISEEANQALNQAATLCRDLGHQVEYQENFFNKDIINQAAAVIICSNLYLVVNQLATMQQKPVSLDLLEPINQWMYTQGGSYSAEDLLQAINTMHAQTRELALLFENFDVLLTPTLARPPVKTGELAPVSEDLASFWKAQTDFVPYTTLFNLTGQPAMSVPLFWTDQGLPLGVQFAGKLGDEGLLLQLARQLEVAKPWFSHFSRLTLIG